MDFAKTLAEIASFLEENNLDYALIGGLALAAYGHPRTTLDIDLVVEYEHQDQIIDFMESRGFTTLHRSEGYSNHLHADVRFGRVDFVYVRGETAAKLFRNRTYVDSPGGLRVPVPKPEHLIAMKVLAMKNDPERTFQEMADIRILMVRPGIDRDEVRRYFDQHGFLDLFDELTKSL